MSNAMIMTIVFSKEMGTCARQTKTVEMEEDVFSGNVNQQDYGLMENVTLQIICAINVWITTIVHLEQETLNSALTTCVMNAVMMTIAWAQDMEKNVLTINAWNANIVMNVMEIVSVIWVCALNVMGIQTAKKENSVHTIGLAKNVS